MIATRKDYKNMTANHSSQAAHPDVEMQLNLTTYVKAARVQFGLIECYADKL